MMVIKLMTNIIPALFLVPILGAAGKIDERPNFLFITWEDVSPRMGCYGDSLAHSPTVDRLAREGILFDNAYAVAGVCAPSRSAIMAARWPISLGSHHMRSGIKLSSDLRCFPSYLREAGYYCYNAGKTDYNFAAPEGSWDVSQKGATWKDRKEGQPFLGVYNFVNTHQGPGQNQPKADQQRSRVPAKYWVKPEEVEVPPYYPDTPNVRQQIANLYNNIAFTDQLTNGMLKRLANDGLAEDTIVFLYGDHGDGIPRVKGHLYHESLRVPLIVYIPEKFRSQEIPPPGSVVKELVSLMDLGPTVMSLAGIVPPVELDGRAFLGHHSAPEPSYLFGHRDRVNSAYAFRRSVRDRRWHYIRNFRPDLAPHPPVRGHVNAPIYIDSRRLHDEGEFVGPAAAWLEDEDCPEHLYDTAIDPHCVNNLAESPEHRKRLKAMRLALQEWQIQEHDLGFVPESIMISRAKKLGYPAKLYAKSDEPFTRHHDLALAWERSDDGREDILKSLDHVDSVDRYWAVLGLAKLDEVDNETTKKLETLLDGVDGAVARATTWTLHRLGITTEETLEPLRKVLRKGNYAQRLEAIQIARRIGPEADSLVPELERLVNLKGGSYYDRYLPSAAELALKEIGTENP